MAKEVFSICETAFRTLEEEIRRRETNWLELSGRRRMRNCEGRRRCVCTFFSREKCLCCTHFGKQRVSLFLSSSRRNGEEGERNLPFVTFDQLFFLFLLPSSSDNKSSFRDDDAGFFLSSLYAKRECALLNRKRNEAESASFEAVCYEQIKEKS